MFIQEFKKVVGQTSRSFQDRKEVSIKGCLDCAIKIWCNELKISLNTTNWILEGYEHYGVNELTRYIYKTWQRKQDFYNLRVVNIIKDRNEDMEILVFVAFGIVAIGYFIYDISQQKQQQTTFREEPIQYNYSLSAHSTVQTPPVQTINKHFLVLVVSASQENFLKSLESKACINVNDGEALYEIAKYLWLGCKTEFSQIKTNINQYSVSKAKESEYDICLVYLELKQTDKGFKPNVNQLDRYDAFRKLADLASNFEVSPRFRMEAYEKIDVYSR